jgi:hypothetical protein
MSTQAGLKAIEAYKQERKNKWKWTRKECWQLVFL